MNGKSQGVEVLRGVISRGVFHLFDVVEFLIHTGLQGELVLKERGSIFFRNGEIVGARTDGFVGFKALQRLWYHEGKMIFSFLVRPEVQDDNLHIRELDLIHLQESADTYHSMIQMIPLDAQLQRFQENVMGANDMEQNILAYLEKVSQPTVQEILDNFSFPDPDLLRTIRDMVKKAWVELFRQNKKLQPRRLERVNLLLISPKTEWIDAFFDGLGLAGYTRRRGRQVFYAYWITDTRRVHIYAVHLMPGMSVGFVLPLLHLAHMVVAISHIPQDLRTWLSPEQVPILRYREGTWYHQNTPLDSLPDFLQDLLPRTTSESGA